MNRGDIIITAPPSPFNKPRPAIILQAYGVGELETVTVVLITSDLLRARGLRIPINPSAENGLRKPSEVMIDNVQTVYLDRIGGIIGKAEPDVLRKVSAALGVFLGLL